MAQMRLGQGIVVSASAVSASSDNPSLHSLVPRERDVAPW